MHVCRKTFAFIFVTLALFGIVGYYTFWVGLGQTWAYYTCRILPAFALAMCVAVLRCLGDEHRYGVWVMVILWCFGLGDLDVLLNLPEHILLVMFRLGGTIFWLAVLWINTTRYEVHGVRFILVSLLVTAFATPLWFMTHSHMPRAYYVMYNILSTFASFLFSQAFLLRLRMHDEPNPYATSMSLSPCSANLIVCAAASFLLAVWTSSLHDVWPHLTIVFQAVHVGLYWLALVALAASTLQRPRFPIYEDVSQYDERIVFTD